MAGATVHDFFNLIAVAVLFPLELLTGAISSSALVLADGVEGIGGADLLSPVSALTKPVAGAIIGLAGENGLAVLLIGVVFLFIALRYLVRLLRALLLGRSEAILHKYIFGTPMKAMFFGVVVTVMVQSSSITTSVIVPLVGAGIVTVAHVFPFVLGANIGTTITALLAALVLAASGGAAAEATLQVAFAHVCFNVFGIALIWPIQAVRNVPVRLAEKLGELSVKNRGYAFAYIAVVFFVIPLVVILATRGMDSSFYDVNTAAPADTSAIDAPPPPDPFETP